MLYYSFYRAQLFLICIIHTQREMYKQQVVLEVHAGAIFWAQLGTAVKIPRSCHRGKVGSHHNRIWKIMLAVTLHRSSRHISKLLFIKI